MPDPRHHLIDGFLAATAGAGPSEPAALRRAIDQLGQEGFLVASLQRGARPALRFLGPSAQLELTAHQLLSIAARLDRGEHEPWADFLLHDSGAAGPPRPPGRP